MIRSTTRRRHHNGRITYELMEDAWRRPESGEWPEWMDASEVAFLEVHGSDAEGCGIRESPASRLERRACPGDAVGAVRRLKEEPKRGIALGGVKLPAAFAAEGLIDEYTFVVHPVIVGRGLRLLEGARDQMKLELVERWELRSGATVQRYRPA